MSWDRQAKRLRGFVERPPSIAACAQSRVFSKCRVGPHSALPGYRRHLDRRCGATLLHHAAVKVGVICDDDSVGDDGPCHFEHVTPGGRIGDMNIGDAVDEHCVDRNRPDRSNELVDQNGAVDGDDRQIDDLSLATEASRLRVEKNHVTGVDKRLCPLNRRWAVDCFRDDRLVAHCHSDLIPVGAAATINARYASSVSSAAMARTMTSPALLEYARRPSAI